MDLPKENNTYKHNQKKTSLFLNLAYTLIKISINLKNSNKTQRRKYIKQKTHTELIKKLTIAFKIFKWFLQIRGYIIRI